MIQTIIFFAPNMQVFQLNISKRKIVRSFLKQIEKFLKTVF